MENKKKTSVGMSVLAIIFPILFGVFLSFVLLLLSSKGMQDITRRFSNSGGWAYQIVFFTMIGTVVASILIFLSARGKRIPAIVVIGSAFTPWLIGIWSSYLGMVMAEAALETANPNVVPLAIAKGVSIALDAQSLGALFSGVLLAGIAWAYAFGALGQRADNRKKMLILASVGSTLPMLSIVAYGVIGAGLAANEIALSIPLVFIAISMVGVTIIGSAAIGDATSDNYNRSFALAMAGSWAAFLAFTAISFSCATDAVTESFGLLEMVDPASRMPTIARGAALFLVLRPVANFGAIAAFVPLVVVGIMSLKRSVWKKQVIRACAIVVVSAVVLSVNIIHANHVENTIGKYVHPFGSHITNFSPTEFTGYSQNSEDRGKIPHVYVLQNRLVSWRGEIQPFQSFDAPAEKEIIVAFLGELADGREPFDAAFLDRDNGLGIQTEIEMEDIPEWLKEQKREPVDTESHYGIQAPSRKEPSESSEKNKAHRFGILSYLGSAGGSDLGKGSKKLVVAFDERISQQIYKGFLRAAQKADIGRIILAGTFGKRRTPEIQNLLDMPYFRHYVHPPVYSVPVDLSSGQSNCKISKEAAYFGKISGSDTVRITSWAHKAEIHSDIPKELVLDANMDESIREKIEIKPRTVCLTLGNDATLLSATLAVERADLVGLKALLSFENYDGSAPPTMESHPRILEDEKVEVMGSLLKEEIRKVVNGHRNEVKYCYERQLAKKPTLSGKVTVKFLINKKGSVQMAKVFESTIGDPTVEKCVAQAVRRWIFPKPEGGGAVIVTYPFKFAAEN